MFSTHMATAGVKGLRQHHNISHVSMD